MPLIIRTLSLLAMAIGGVAIATWAWQRGVDHGTRYAEKDGQLLFSRGVAYGAMTVAHRPDEDEKE